MKLHEIEEIGGYSMSDVNLAGRNRITGLPNDERYIPLGALKKHHEEGTLSIVQVRQFFYMR